MTKEYAIKLASILSIIPCKGKIPIEAGWSKLPDKTPDQIELYNAERYGCRCGYMDVECIDIDIHVLSNADEKKQWWSEFFQLLCDTIFDFEKKVVIARTQSGGYHIIYKCEKVGKNTKIARLKGMNEALIESRGWGGQFILYDQFEGERKYHHVNYISVEEREMIWSVCRSYNYIESEKISINIDKKEELITSEGRKPWDDYNARHTCLELIEDEFDVVRRVDKSIIVRRHGAKSPHSGYIYSNTNTLFLHSTGSRYPAEKQLSPFSIFAHKHHGGDYSAAAKAAYSAGYGDRVARKAPETLAHKPQLVEVEIEKEKKTEIPLFPLHIFPIEYQNYIKNSHAALGLSVDYMGAALLFNFSLIVGNSLQLEIKPGWRETASIWLALVGGPGIGKTPAINHMLRPLRDLNVREQRYYQRNLEDWHAYEKLDKKEKEMRVEVKEPKSGQFIAGDITLEALVELHEANPSGVGVFKDELAGWLKDMNKYRQGSDLEFWLSSWSGAPASLNRKVARSAFVDRPFIPVIGGIQPSVFEKFIGEENRENGFVDRILVCYPDLKVEKFNDNQIKEEEMQWYADIVQSAKGQFDAKFGRRTSHMDEIEALVVRFDAPAAHLWSKIFDEITERQNNEDSSEFLRSMLPKQKSYCARFCLILLAIKASLSESIETECDNVTLEGAWALSQYFTAMGTRLQEDNRDMCDIRRHNKKDKTVAEKIMDIYKDNPNFNRSKTAELLGISRRQIIRAVEKIENEAK